MSPTGRPSPTGRGDAPIRRDAHLCRPSFGAGVRSRRSRATIGQRVVRKQGRSAGPGPSPWPKASSGWRSRTWCGRRCEGGDYHHPPPNALLPINRRVRGLPHCRRQRSMITTATASGKRGVQQRRSGPALRRSGTRLAVAVAVGRAIGPVLLAAGSATCQRRRRRCCRTWSWCSRR